jgi:hypothetical protein
MSSVYHNSGQMNEAVMQNEDVEDIHSTITQM